MKRRTIGLIAGGTLVMLVAGLAAVGSLVTGSQNERARALEGRLQGEIAAFHGRRWERPVLRGAAIEGNAAEEQARVMGALGALPEDAKDELGKALRAGKVAPEAMLSAARAHRAGLDELRASTQRGWAWTHIELEKGPAAQLPSFTTYRRARKLLLALASEAEPAECLRIAADTIRLSQDMAPGTGIIGLMLTAVDIDATAPVMVRCAARANGEARAEAARELRVLVEHPAPVDTSFEHEALMIAAGALPLAVRVPLLPHDAETFDRWKSQGLVLGAVEVFLGELPGTRKLDARRYPEGFAWMDATTAAHRASANPLVSLASVESIRYLHKDAAAQARLRATAAIVEALAAEGAKPADVATILARPAFVDPFTAAPLRWALREGKLAVWSVGPDKKDAGGAEDDVGAQVP